MVSRPDQSESLQRTRRRSFLTTTVSAGMAGLSLPSLLARRAEATVGGNPVSDTAVIQVWLGGGPTHFETYDPKPQAPAEYRGPFQPISTCLPGTQVCELLPRHAQILDRVALLRSVEVGSGSHDVGMFICTTGKPKKNQPATGSYVARIRGSKTVSLPPYVHLGFPQTANLVFVPNFKSHYLGGAFDPFYVYDDPTSEKFRVPNLQLVEGLSSQRLRDRKSLLDQVDQQRREFTSNRAAASVDHFTESAFEVVSGPQARKAFDLTQEKEATRQHYGMHRWGQSCLLARRLVEAGVPFVTVNFDPHSFSFDMHGNVEKGMKSAGPRMDSAICALVEELYQRGLDKKVLLIVWGEFGRTPKVNKTGGRDHWGPVMSVLLSGGGLRVGQVIGSSTSKGEVPKDRPLRPYDVLATMYRHLGIDPRTTFPDHAGRPLYLLDEGEVIQELV